MGEGGGPASWVWGFCSGISGDGSTRREYIKTNELYCLKWLKRWILSLLLKLHTYTPIHLTSIVVLREKQWWLGLRPVAMSMEKSGQNWVGIQGWLPASCFKQLNGWFQHPQKGKVEEERDWKYWIWMKVSPVKIWVLYRLHVNLKKIRKLWFFLKQ